MEEAGVTLLDNHWVTLERQGAFIVLVGIQDPNGPADRPTPESVFAGMPQGQYTVLLYHRNTEPQVWGLFPRYDAGVYQVQGATLVVSRGLGNNPGGFRLFNGPEVPMLTLISEGLHTIPEDSD